MLIQLDKVPLRDANLSPEEILMSESQERMCAVVSPDKIERFLEICKKWEVVSTVIGEVTDGKHLVITWNGEIIVDVPPRTVAHDGPVYNRPIKRPAEQDALIQNTTKSLSVPSSGEELRQTLLDLMASPNLADKSWITSQYDRYVQGNTISASPSDASIVRIDEETFLGVAVSTDANGRWCRLNPYTGTQLALAEAFRNVAASGAKPLAITNCLNFGSPEDPGVMWQFSESVRALADGALEMGLPVTGGNVSFYNQTGAVAILPTPVIGVLGVIDDVRRAIPLSYKKAGLELILLGETWEDFDGGEWAHLQKHLGGLPPQVNLKHEMRLGKLMSDARDQIAAAHDLSDGGFAVAISEMALGAKVGATVNIPEDHFVHLFSETPGRILVAIESEKIDELIGRAIDLEITTTRIGKTGGDQLIFENLFSISIAEMSEVNCATLPRLFG
jgi:phosphoribosylformylglycinamidine synthase